ncbi:MAG: STAS domain-containing protein [Oribacterium sp.]|nr:STAS domain-containing protein [Oribacterium sp.]
METAGSYIYGLRTVDKDTEKRIMDACGGLSVWTMTVEKETSDQMDPDLPFAVETDFSQGRLSVSIQGRMDTMTAPELLKKFQELPGKPDEIEVDVSRMAYVSSAGLRVFLIMYKSLSDKSRFRMTGVSESVREILETTGFDENFGNEYEFTKAEDDTLTNKTY